MPRSIPDDDIMDLQQAKDLGHATKSEREQKNGAKEGSQAQRIEEDVRANRGIGTLTQPRKKSDTEKAMDRAVERSKR